MFTCKNDASHKENVVAKLSAPATVKDPTCTAKGTARVTATAEFNGKTYTDTHDTDIPATGHEFEEGELYCKRCGEPRAPLLSTNVEYKDKYSDVYVTVLSIVHSYVEGETEDSDIIFFTVKYTLENKSTEEGYEEGTFYIFTESGRKIEGEITDENETDEIFPGDLHEHTVTFSVPKNETPLLLEYRSANHSGYASSGSQIFADDPNAAMYWKTGD